MGGKNMRTLSELGRHGAAVEVTCLGCGNTATFMPLDLTNWLRGDADPQNLNFRCMRCRSRRFRWRPVIGVPWRRTPPSPMR
jgi:hypothetical protein